jgi:hypothetical protein
MTQWWGLCLYLISCTCKVEITNTCSKIIIFVLVCRYCFIYIAISCIWNGGGSSNMHICRIFMLDIQRYQTLRSMFWLNDQGWCCLTYNFFKASKEINRPAWETKNVHVILVVEIDDMCKMKKRINFWRILSSAYICCRIRSGLFTISLAL